MRKNRRRRTTVSVYSPEIDLLDDDFYDCLLAFLRHQKDNERSPYTIEYYRRSLTNFANILEERRFKSDLRAITGDSIEQGYVRYAYDELGLKHATVASTLRAVRAFLNWAVGKYIEYNPMDSIVIGTPKPPKIETFSREQLKAIMSQPDPQLFVGLRDLTIMTIFLETGVRVRELCDITVDDVRFEDNQILIRGKNGEDRLVPIQSQTRRILKRYIQARGASHVDWLFVSVDDEKMNRDSVRARISKYGRQANIENVRCSPHTFRHTFAKMSVQNGADLFTLQAILGHKTVEMVRRYVNMYGSDIQDAHGRFSPVENLRIKL